MQEQQKSEILALKQYLLSLGGTPLPPNGIILAPNSGALKAAIAGLEKEHGRLEREERLQKKFAKVADAGGVKKGEDDVDMLEYVQMSKEDVKMKVGHENDLDNVSNDEDDWQEAGMQELQQTEQEQNSESKSTTAPMKVADLNAMNNQRQLASQKWASSTITRIANSKVEVETPLGAVALALHTGLLELSSNSGNGSGNKEPIFTCTGTPTDIISQFSQSESNQQRGGSGGGGGFAPPIRELPRGVLVPSDWEKGSTNGVVAFRYKRGNTTAHLVVLKNNQHSSSESSISEVVVMLGPNPALKEHLQLKFPLSHHINLDGLNAAMSKVRSSRKLVSPCLFYKSLSELFLQFGTLFDLLSEMNSTFGEIVCTNDDDDAMEEFATNAPAGAKEGLTLQSNSTVKCTVQPPLPMSEPMPPCMASTSIPIMNTTVTTSCAAASSAKAENMEDPNHVPRPTIPPNGAAVDTSVIDPLRVLQRGRHGDFEGDLLPGGPQPGMLPPGGGSQVGPNHPMFDRTFGDDNGNYGYDDELGRGGGSFGIPGVGGMGMRPRFDPYGPPGGPTEPGRGGRFGPGRGGGGRGGRGRGPNIPPGGLGYPNPDHMRPPGGDYFS